jgi:hypothetical protein
MLVQMNGIGIYLSAAIVLLATALARADEPPEAIAIHGFVDGYYAWNVNDPGSHESFVPGTGTTAKRADEFALNLAAIDIVRDAAPLGFHLSLVAGKGADVVHAAESEGFRHIYQASILYKASDRLTASLNTFDGPALAHDDSHWRHFGDLVAQYKVTPALTLGGSLDRGRQDLPGDTAANWLSVAAYGRYAIDTRRALADGTTPRRRSLQKAGTARRKPKRCCSPASWPRSRERQTCGT